MFKNEFQGGEYLDVYSVQGKDPLSKLKLHGSPRKEFDNDIRTFVLLLQGDTSRCSLAYPKSNKQTLHLTQSFIVFQVFVGTSQSFSLEVALTTQNNIKFRIILSSSNREIVLTAHHIKLPCSVLEMNTWCNLCLDLNDLIGTYLDGNVFQHVDSVVISANSKLRRIFTLREKPDSSFDIPRVMKLPQNVTCILQMIDAQTFFDANINIRSGTGDPERRTPIRKQHSFNNDNSHIAFGSRVRANSKDNVFTNDHPTTNQSTLSNSSRVNNFSKPQRISSGDIETSRNRQNSTSNPHEVSLTPHVHNILPSKPNNKHFTNKTERSNIHYNNNNTTNTPNDNSNQKSIQPKPPDASLSSRTRSQIRKPRVKSADLSSRTIPLLATPKNFSKSADSRNRRRPSLRDSDNSTELNTERLPPLQLKKGISQSNVELEKVEQNISGKRDTHFKSKSLTVLPNIEKNHRYKTPRSEEPRDSNNCNASQRLSGADAYATDEDTCEELMTPADDYMVDEYLKQRTRSSCQDDESTYSSGMSTNSDLYTYSSRPRSISATQQQEERRKNRTTKSNNSNSHRTNDNSRSVSNNGDNSNNSASINGDKSDSVLNKGDKSKISVSNNGGESTESLYIGDKTSITGENILIEKEEKENTGNTTFTLPVACNEMKHTNIIDPEPNHLDLSWEYSESTSMLVIPSEFRRDNRMNANEEHDDNTEVDISIEIDADDEKMFNEEDQLNLETGRQQRTSSTLLDGSQENYNAGTDVQSRGSSPSNHRNGPTNIVEAANNDVEIHENTNDKANKDSPSEHLSSSSTTDVKSNVDGFKSDKDNVLNTSYVMRESCDSDSMSWLNQSVEHTSTSMTAKDSVTLDKIRSPYIILQQRLKEQLGSMFCKDDSEDGLSDCSDDTTYTDLPAKKFRNYRYQDEIKSIGSTLDLSATIPATPRVGDQAEPSRDENNNVEGGLSGTANEELLDLMYDPVLNCYYDPVTHKYYELN